MKISDIRQIEAKAAATPAKAVDEAPRAPADKVNAGGATKVAASIETSRAGAGASRAARLHQLTAQVKAGTYQPDPQRIADQILDAAQIDAALRSLLS